MTTSAADRKEFKSAICIAPPIELCNQVQQWRQNHDAAFNRWMPHINLIFPFVPLDMFESKLPQLQEAVGRVPAFKIKFNEFSYFEHGKKCVLWLAPETDRPFAIHELQSALTGALPGFNELSDRGFTPHMTIGQFGTLKETQSKISQFKAVLTPIEFMVTEIPMINRVGDTPFVVINTLKLGPPN
ncbi:hypothetical protein PPL_10351 [Heterostelium album PN500]|uniref:2'-5' RNA ligase n=1 Tax=Heterostelium pallidum (strain ATCC 26659 / Pp 5 / PN500) TaxID=670386 RepID=D3BQ31_HETP5|nr:hypothetical protein PPL_10351 [Heterostelium album PN500]EFA76582.1 hypothetical protein PPL_10351 [Heterostelium album PN500]|eukprot:XP_020428714.1 hypothetical protein PPL_10351 [Heterostelium album PN500]